MYSFLSSLSFFVSEVKQIKLILSVLTKLAFYFSVFLYMFGLKNFLVHLRCVVTAFVDVN